MHGNESGAKSLQQEIQDDLDGGYEALTSDYMDFKATQTEMQLRQRQADLLNMINYANELVEQMAWERGLIEAVLYLGAHK